MKFKLSMLAVAATAMALPVVASASGLSRTDQSTAILFEQGRLIEVGMLHVGPDLPGNYSADFQKLAAPYGLTNLAKPNSDAPKGYNSTSWGFKTDVLKDGEQSVLRLALIYDQPWGVDYGYSDGFYTGWGVNVDAHNLTALLGGQVADGVWLFGGPAVENTIADINVVLRMPLSKPEPNPMVPTDPFGFGQHAYHTHFLDTNWGYVFGAAYEIPKYAMRFALTYRSEIEHEQNASETLLTSLYSAKGLSTGVIQKRGLNEKFKYKSPKSINLDMQSGVTQSTLLMVSLRWVDHSEFVVNPPAWNMLMKQQGGYNPLASYDKASIEYSVSVGQSIIKDKLAIAVGVSGDTGTGGDSSDSSPFGPTKSTFTYTLGGSYTFSKQLSLSLGAAYTQIKGGATKMGGKPVASFDDGSAIAYGGKLSLRF